MKRHISRLVPIALLACAIVAAPVLARAQATTDSTTKKKSSTSTDSTATKKKSGGHPFHGNVKSVDKAAKSFTIGNSTYYITSETKITKAGKPATLEDAVLGEEAGGYARPGDGEKMNATSVRFGPKTPDSAAPASPDKKKSKSSTGDTTTK